MNNPMNVEVINTIIMDYHHRTWRLGQRFGDLIPPPTDVTVFGVPCRGGRVVEWEGDHYFVTDGKNPWHRLIQVGGEP